MAWLKEKNFDTNSSSCSFSIPVRDISDLRCLYVVQVSGSLKHQIRSPPSDPVQPAKAHWVGVMGTKESTGSPLAIVVKAGYKMGSRSGSLSKGSPPGIKGIVYIISLPDWLLTGFYITSGQPPAPTITAFPGRVINRGDTVTIRCEATINKLRFHLYHGTNIRYLDAEGNRADFPIINANENNSGYYYCIYNDSRYNPTPWSAPSDSLQIQVIDLKKPEISWDTDPEDRSKDRFTCFIPEPPAEYQLLRCFLYQNLTTPLTDKTFIANSCSCSFSIPVQDISDLRCLYVVQVSDSLKRQIRSPLSDPVQPAEDLKKPEISWDTDPEDRSKARFICSAPNNPEKYQVIQCVLYNNMAWLEENNVDTNSFSCAFSVPVRDLSEIRCSYIVEVSPKHQIRSPLSDPAQPGEYCIHKLR
ncbi:V-set and transmembrane domain-containing protein 1 [Spea bombifrons]|uniref:V-set and transmembrane domain-containing protein 1 n=1 Tax=Spea bombifrons TaxID=233779 RepID=UPI00234ABD24|nr:V-set and transmembrane domain-containing protein 1 [Spea bombifrons]